MFAIRFRRSYEVLAVATAVSLPLVPACSAPGRPQGLDAPLFSFQVQSLTENFNVDPALCSYRGKRVAVVPGDAFRGLTRDAEYTFLLPANQSSYDGASTPGNLKFRVGQSGQWHMLEGGTAPPPEWENNAASFLTEMGFNVIDRAHTQEVWNEQILAERYAGREIGELLNADLLFVGSVLLSPQVRFAAHSSGAWALMPDPLIRQQIDFVDVTTGNKLGGLTTIATALSLCGYDSVEARVESMPTGTQVVWYVKGRDGKARPFNSIDFASMIEARRCELIDKRLAVWQSTCSKTSR